MRTVRRSALAVAAAFLALSASVGAASSDVSLSVRYGEPTFVGSTPRAPALELRGAGAEDSLVRRDPTWPAMSRIAPAIPLRTYVSDAPVSLIENDGPTQRVRAFVPLEGGAGF